MRGGDVLPSDEDQLWETVEVLRNGGHGSGDFNQGEVRLRA